MLKLIPQCLWLLIAILSGCQPADPPASVAIPTEPERIFRTPATYKAEDRAYKAHWGQLELPVVNDPLPANKAKRFEVPVDSFFSNLNKRMYFTKGGQPMKLDMIAIVVYNAINGQPSMFHLYERNKFAVDTTHYYDQTIRAYAEYGAHFSLRGFVGNTPINSVAFRLKDTSDRYFPPVYFNGLDYVGKEVFPFQMYVSTGRKTLIRMDTLSEETRTINDMYKDKAEAYKIVHIPGFKTIRRMYQDTEKLWPSDNFTRITLLDHTDGWPLDMESYPEFYDFKNKNIQLAWGPLSVPEPLPEPRQRRWGPLLNGYSSDPKYHEMLPAAVQKPLWLTIDGHKLRTLRFDCWVISGDGEDYRFITEDIRHPVIRKVLEKLPRRSSIYIDNLLFEDEAGVVKWFPVPFVFNFP